MRNRFIAFTVVFMLIFSSFTRADEGMWLLTLLNKNYADMKAQGFKLTPEDIYNVNKPSLKDAIVSFGGFCTGEIISDQGLILTNHHCGYGAIQMHSTVENDYLGDGFWAKTLADEIPTPDLFVKFLVKVEDVTSTILATVTDKMTQDERTAAITVAIEKQKAIDEKTYPAKKGYDIKIIAFFTGNSYYRLIYQIYNDVRYVGSPPSSIGKFGYDTDNWMWPRHTGDFSMFRVYADKDGNPAEYSATNIPFKPKHSLPVSLKGYAEGDFTMVMGYPGRTDRYLTSYGVEELINVTNKNIAKIRGIRQEILMTDMLSDPKIMIQYASKYARSSNYWKYAIGQNKGLKKLDVYDIKQATETEFTKWVNEDKTRAAKYGEALTLLKNAYKNRTEYLNANQYITECLRNGTEFISIAYATFKLDTLLNAGTKIESNNATLLALKEAATTFFKDYSSETDKKVAVRMLQLFVSDINEKYYPVDVTDIKTKYAGDFEKFIETLFESSIFVDETKFNAFLENPTKAAIEKDLAFMLATSVYEKYNELVTLSDSYTDDLAKGKRLFLAGLMEMKKDKFFYPDANSTMRLTWGKVGKYSPADAIEYNYFTTLDGIIEKEDSTNWEFYVEPKLKELFKNKDYGQYGVDGKINVCFTSNNDITGGNSGSPVMNGNGELIGLAFDGNWEAMSGDIAFETQLQKCINVDIRYVLFIIDKFAGATRLIDEMKLIK